MPRKDLNALLNKAAAQIKQTTRNTEPKKLEKSESQVESRRHSSENELVQEDSNYETKFLKKINTNTTPDNYKPSIPFAKQARHVSSHINERAINSVSSDENELEAYLNKLSKVTKTHQTGDLNDDKSISSDISLSHLESKLDQATKPKKSFLKKQVTESEEASKHGEEKEKVTEALQDNKNQTDVTSGQSRILATLQKASEFQKKYKQPPRRTFSVSDSESDFSFISDVGNGQKPKSGYSYIKDLVEAKKTSKDEEPVNVLKAKPLSSSLFHIQTVDELLKPLEEEKSISVASPKDSVKEDLTVGSDTSQDKEPSVSAESSSSKHLIAGMLTKLNLHNVEDLEEQFSYNGELEKSIEESVSVHTQEKSEAEVFKDNIIMNLASIDASKIDSPHSEPQSFPAESIKEAEVEKEYSEDNDSSSIKSAYEEKYAESDFEEITEESLSLMKNVKLGAFDEVPSLKSEDSEVKEIKRSVDLTVPKTNVAVQTESHSAFQDILNPQASFLPEYNLHHLEYQNISRFLIRDDILSGLTSFSPAQLAVDNILKSQVNLIKSFTDSHRTLYLSQVNSLRPDFQYTTLHNTLQYINHLKKKKNKKKYTKKKGK